MMDKKIFSQEQKQQEQNRGTVQELENTFLGDNQPPEVAQAASAGFAEILEVSGVIKWFDTGKGFGFIIPDNGLPDVMLHVSCLRRDGYQTAYEGARILCDVIGSPRGLQALKVKSMDESTAIHPSQSPIARVHEQVTPVGDFVTVQVKWFNRERGFGFLTRGEQTDDIFIHMEVLRRYGMTELLPGQIVEVRYGTGSRGYMAAEIRPVQNAHYRHSH